MYHHGATILRWRDCTVLSIKSRFASVQDWQRKSHKKTSTAAKKHIYDLFFSTLKLCSSGSSSNGSWLNTSVGEIKTPKPPPTPSSPFQPPPPPFHPLLAPSNPLHSPHPPTPPSPTPPQPLQLPPTPSFTSPTHLILLILGDCARVYGMGYKTQLYCTCL